VDDQLRRGVVGSDLRWNANLDAILGEPPKLGSSPGLLIVKAGL